MPLESNEELSALKEEVNSVNEKLQQLTPEELEQVSGGTIKLKVKKRRAIG